MSLIDNLRELRDDCFSQNMDYQAEQIHQSIEWLQAIDDDLVCSHIGTIDSMEPKDAINKLGVFNQSVGEYFARDSFLNTPDEITGEF